MMHIKVKETVFNLENRPTPECHASTVLVSDGIVMAAWFGGRKEGDRDVGIWFSRRTEAGWEKPVRLSVRQDIPHWNPVLFRLPGGRIILYYKAGYTIPDWRTCFRTSDDGGLTWSEEVELVSGPAGKGGRGPVKNKPIRLSDGTILAPASIEYADTGIPFRAFVDRLDNNGNCVESSPLLEAPGGASILQPTLWESAPGHVHMLLRSSAAVIFRSDSGDGGRTWCTPYPISLPNNNSGIDLVRTTDGTLVLVYNPVGKNWGRRTPLTVACSRDNGQSFEEALVLENSEGEYSYPAIVAEGDSVHVTYTDKRKQIAYCHIRLSDHHIKE